MKVKQLIKKLQELDENLDVCLSSDQEGNSYSKLSSLYTCPEKYNGVELEDIPYYTEKEEKAYNKRKKKTLILFP